MFQEDEYIEDTNSNYEEYNISAKNYSFSSVNEDRVSYSTSGDNNSSADEEEVQADASDQIHTDIRSSKKDKDADDMLDLMDNNWEVDDDSLEVEEKNDEQNSNAEDDMMGKAIFTTSSRKPHPNAKIETTSMNNNFLKEKKEPELLQVSGLLNCRYVPHFKD